MACDRRSSSPTVSFSDSEDAVDSKQALEKGKAALIKYDTHVIAPSPASTSSQVGVQPPFLMPITERWCLWGTVQPSGAPKSRLETGGAIICLPLANIAAVVAVLQARIVVCGFTVLYNFAPLNLVQLLMFQLPQQWHSQPSSAKCVAMTKVQLFPVQMGMPYVAIVLANALEPSILVIAKQS
jgi:hypothetical protein